MTNHTVTVKVRHCGAGQNDGFAPHILVEFQAWLRSALDEIPADCLDSAEIDFEPDYEHGEHYSAVRITYERPETAEETAKRQAEHRAHWESQLASAHDRIAYCEQQLFRLA